MATKPPISICRRDGGGGCRLVGPARPNSSLYFFYPKDDTSGCTAEAIDFNALAPEFAAAGTALVGVSPDTPRATPSSSASTTSRSDSAADATKATLEAYGVWREKSMYGRKYMGVERSTFLIDPKGRVARVWRKVKVAGHAEEGSGGREAAREAGVCERLTLMGCNRRVMTPIRAGSECVGDVIAEISVPAGEAAAIALLLFPRPRRNDSHLRVAAARPVGA